AVSLRPGAIRAARALLCWGDGAQATSPWRHPGITLESPWPGTNASLAERRVNARLGDQTHRRVAYLGLPIPFHPTGFGRKGPHGSAKPDKGPIRPLASRTGKACLGGSLSHGRASHGRSLPSDAAP